MDFEKICFVCEDVYNKVERGAYWMDGRNYNKTDRILFLYTKLLDGKILKKDELAEYFGVNGKSVQRDLEDIRDFLDKSETEDGVRKQLVYDYQEKGHRMEQDSDLRLSAGETLAVCKILLESRAFTKKEMVSILDRIVANCIPKEDCKPILDLLSNEEFHYIELQHKKKYIEKMWDIAQAIQQNRFIEVTYQRSMDGKVVNRYLKPAAIMFSEYYFYLTAFIDDEEVQKGFDVINDSSPTIYRIDRIQSVKVSKERFHIPYADRFEEGEFRKRVQFMYGGRLQRVEFVYSGVSVESVLDRLPTAKIVNEKDGKYTITAEVFGKGIEMWIRSQGDMISDVRYK